MSITSQLAKDLLDVMPPIVQRLRQEFRARLRRDFSLPQFRILSAVAGGECHARDIAKRHGVSQAAMSKMVENLVRRGFLRRCAQSADRRHRILSLTAKGEAFYLKTRQQVATHLDRTIAARMTRQQQRDLQRGLQALREFFQ